MTPIYTAENCHFAFELCWSLTLFWKVPHHSDDWLTDLQSATEQDGVRILHHRMGGSDCSMFLISTRPDLPPSKIPWSVKGRLQYLVRKDQPAAFQRNYDLRSVGSTSGSKVEAYVTAQLGQHAPDFGDLTEKFRDLQIINPDVNLFRPRFTAHARYSCNLHIVLVHRDRHAELRRDVWIAIREMLRSASSKKGHLLSRVGIVPDHLHFTIGVRPDEVPRDVALSYMNNLAFVHQMQPAFMHGCYIAGFGEYDLGAIQESNIEMWCGIDSERNL